MLIHFKQFWPISRKTGCAVGGRVIVGLYASRAVSSNIQVVEAFVAGYKK